MTQELGSEPWSVDEEALAEAQPRVRALQIQRYEQLWNVVDGHVQGHLAEDRPVDPRFLEIGIRVLKEEAVLYRLAKSLPPSEEDEDPGMGIDRVTMALAQLAEVEARMTPPPPADTEVPDTGDRS